MARGLGPCTGRTSCRRATWAPSAASWRSARSETHRAPSGGASPPQGTRKGRRSGVRVRTSHRAGVIRGRVTYPRICPSPFSLPNDALVWLHRGFCCHPRTTRGTEVGGALPLTTSYSWRTAWSRRPAPSSSAAPPRTPSTRSSAACRGAGITRRPGGLVDGFVSPACSHTLRPVFCPPKTCFVK